MVVIYAGMLDPGSCMSFNSQAFPYLLLSALVLIMKIKVGMYLEMHLSQHGLLALSDLLPVVHCHICIQTTEVNHYW